MAEEVGRLHDDAGRSRRRSASSRSSCPSAIGRQRDDVDAGAVRAMVSTTSAVVRMQAAGQHRLVPLGDAVGHQHRLGARRSSRRTSRRWRPPCRSACATWVWNSNRYLQRALRDLRLVGRVGGEEFASAGSGDRRSPARDGGRRRRRRRTAPTPAATVLRGQRAQACARPRARPGGRGRSTRPREPRVGGTSANSSSIDGDADRGQHVARGRRR